MSPISKIDPFAVPHIAGSPDSLGTATTVDTVETQLPEIQSFKAVKDFGPVREFPHFRDAIIEA